VKRYLITTLALAAMLSAWLAAPSAQAEDCKVALKVDGMMCSACSAKVTEALKQVEGVKAADVSLDKKLAVVCFDSAKTSADKLVAAVNKTEFKAQLVTFKCDSCGKTAGAPGACCGKPMTEVAAKACGCGKP
jgi:mercuric ion binding protein